MSETKRLTVHIVAWSSTAPCHLLRPFANPMLLLSCPEPQVPGLLPSGSGCWSPAHRWGLLWSPPAELAQQGCQGWMSRDTRGRMRGTVPCSGTPFGLQPPCAWCQTLTGWRCILGTSAPWGLFPAPLTRQMGSCLPHTK